MSEQSKLGADGLEVVAYLRADANGKPEMSEDCVCEDPIYPNYDGDESVSMPMVRLTDAQRLLSQRDLDSGLMQLALNAAKDQICVLEDVLAQRDAEVERLNGLLASQRLIIAMLGTCGMNIGSEREQLRNKLAALESQQAASVGGEREAFERWCPLTTALLPNGHDYLSENTRLLWGTWQARAALSPAGGGVFPALTPEEREDLMEFHEAVCCDAGHRVDKEGMRRLAEIGAVEWVGFGRHRLTEFGVYLLNAKPQANSQEGSK